MSARASGRALRERSLASQAVTMAGASAVAQVVNALIFVAVARASSPADFGVVVAVLGVATAAAGAIDFGSNTLWIRELAAQRMPVEAYEKRLAAKLAAGLAAAVLVTACLLASGADRRWLMGAPVALALVFEQACLVRLAAAAQGQRVALALVVDKLVAGSVLAAVLVGGHRPADWLWLCLALGTAAGGSVALVLTRHGGTRPRLRLARVNPWRGARSYGLYGLAVSAQSLDVAVMGGIGGSSAAGLYGAVNRWTQPMGLLAASFASASIPFVARARSGQEALEAVRRAAWLPLSAVLGCIVVAAAAPGLVDVVLGDSYEGAAVVLQLLAGAALVSVLNQPLAAFLQARGQEVGVARGMVVVVAVQLGLLAVLVPRLGVVGAGVASVTAQVGLLVVLLSSFARLHREGAPVSLGADALADDAAAPAVTTSRVAR
ncbi:lipopolysaccharide biosynthesis protein [Cellulomonas sp. NS3]|uniref:lipopolysaccharide biosynthesis protein n=1 Tax=Cellulomonas sp. NS3 TaxID=2973977 RepID=UPI002162593C|nr:polysaccharide biosynthesis C-terminal domain-containing protein [Cellulomonas sp. NS3]